MRNPFCLGNDVCQTTDAVPAIMSFAGFLAKLMYLAVTRVDRGARMRYPPSTPKTMRSKNNCDENAPYGSRSTSMPLKFAADETNGSFVSSDAPRSTADTEAS